MDSNACNYLSIANVDDGSCKFTGTTTSNSDNSTSQYQVSAEDFQCDECLANGDTVTISSSVESALGLSGTTYYIGEYIGNDEDGDEICDDDEQVGCDDPAACNYRLDPSGNEYSQAQNAYNQPATDADGNALYITESCYYDEDLGYGVTPQGETCENYCQYEDACEVCGGDGVDTDNDGVCDDVDLCKNPLACNYTADPTVSCKFLTECGVCSDGVDSDDDGYIDGSNDDTDDDGICDTSDNCYDLNACNYLDAGNVACKYLTECGVCSDGSDSDNDGYIDSNDDDSDDDGLCDDEDNCTDMTKCNYDVRLYPGNASCFEDADSDGVCDVHEVVGCQDATACNYNSEATDNDTSLCLFADDLCETCGGSGTDGSGYVTLHDSDGDGICDDADLCSDVAACNYDASPTQACGVDSDDNGTCDNAEIEGCGNSTACNYNSSATRDDGSCVFAQNCEVCSGATDGTGTVIAQDSDFDGVCDGSDNCSDVTACNYIAANSLNAACEYATAGYNCQGDCLLDVDNDGICEYNGADQCSDVNACNYAESSNPSCLYYDSCGDCVASAPDQLGYDPLVHCDCDGNVYDVMGYCGGTCLEDVDEDGICDSIDPCLTPGESPDECGVCGGPGAIYECGCFDLPEEGCSCEPDGTVTYPVLGEDCDGNCLYGFTIVDNHVVCNYFDNAEITDVVEPFQRTQIGNTLNLEMNYHRLQDWIRQIDTLHHRMSANLDDGSLTGASQRLTIEDEILDKGKLNVVGNTKLSGLVQMDSNVVIVGNLVVEKNATIKGTTFSRGGIETSSMEMAGDLTVGGEAVIDGALEVYQTTLLHDSLTVMAPLIIGSDHDFTVDNAGNTRINGKVTVMDSLIATSNGTSLGDLDALATKVTTLQATGASIFNGAVSIHSDTELTGDLDVSSNTTINGTLDVDGATTMGSVETESLSNSGALSSNSISNATLLSTSTLTVENSADIATLEVSSSAEVSGILSVKSESNSLLFGVTPGANNGSLGLMSLPGDVKIYSSSTAYTNTPQSPEISLMSSGDVTASGKLSSNYLETTSTTTVSKFKGPLRVEKSTSLLDGLEVEVGGVPALQVHNNNGTIQLSNETTINNNLKVAGGGNVTIGTAASNSTLTVNGTTTVKSLTVTSGTSLTGALTATTGYFSTGLSTGGVARIKQGLIVGDGIQSYPVPTNYMALFDGSTSGMSKSNGIKIRVNQGNGQVSNSNEFITFENNAGQLVGRIRGENSSDWTSDGFKAQERGEKIYEVSTASIAAVHATLKAVNETGLAIGDWVLVGSKFIPDSWMVFWPGIDWGDVPANSWRAAQQTAEGSNAWFAAGLNIAEAAASATRLGIWDSNLNSDHGDYGGISYASGNGDYAEYIPRLNIKERFSPRQIVGIKNGFVTLNTANADHLMVISTAPIVLGNEPLEENIYRYEKVAFLGQVPVDILGTVESGDYILPSGDNDGFGIAVNPDEIEFDQIVNIVGLAWESGSDPYFNTVNVAVGLDQSGSAQKIVALRDQLGRMQSEMAELTAMVVTSSQSIDEEETARTSWRLFKKRGVRSATPEITKAEEASSEVASFTSAGNQSSSMLGGMSEAQIVSAVQDARNGKVPQQWVENLNGSELNTIVQTVVNHHVEQAEQEAQVQANKIKDDAFESFAHQMENLSHNAESLEEIQADMAGMMSQLGVDESKMNLLYNQFMGSVISHEITQENLTKMLRSDEAKELWKIPVLSTIKPGTQAEKRFVANVQYQMFEILNREFPELTEQMPEVQKVLDDASARPGFSLLEISKKPTSTDSEGVNSRASLKK